MIDISKQLKILMIQKDLKQIEVAEKLGTIRQVLNRMLSRDNGLWKLSEIERIADAMGYDVEIKFIDRDADTKMK